MGDIYDGAFRTILNDCRQLVIPVINEIFHENYTGDERIEFGPNEHFLDQQDDADVKRVTDTNFKIFGKLVRKYHLECESGYPDGRITVRLFEYDSQIALDERGIIGTFDKRTIIELSRDVIKEIAQKYENVQKGVGGIMGGALIETEARRILNKGKDEARKKTALVLLEMGKLTIEEISAASELSIAEVEQLAQLQTV